MRHPVRCLYAQPLHMEVLHYLLVTHDSAMKKKKPGVIKVYSIPVLHYLTASTNYHLTTHPILLPHIVTFVNKRVRRLLRLCLLGIAV